MLESLNEKVVNKGMITENGCLFYIQLCLWHLVGFHQQAHTRARFFLPPTWGFVFVVDLSEEKQEKIGVCRTPPQ